MGRESDHIAVFEDHVSDEGFIEGPHLIEYHTNDTDEDDINDVKHSPGYAGRVGRDENRYLIAGDTTILSEEDSDGHDVVLPDDEDVFDALPLESAKKSRKTSDAISTLPDDLECYKSTLPARSPLSLSSRHHGSPGPKGHPAQHREYLCTPPSMPMLHSPTHSRSNSALRQDARPAFRNPSSVRATQFSSPSPRSGSPSPRLRKHTRNLTADYIDERPPSSLRHSDHRAQSRSSTPSRQTLSRHPNPKKEYPLVLLHCTVSVLTLPAAFPAEALIATGVPEKAIKDVVLLNQKMNATVLERGILIQHPGDDYELLRERVLENLDLRRPRVGPCGHFRSASPSSDEERLEKHTPSTEYHEQARYDRECKSCVDCPRHVCTDIMADVERAELQRWDVRIYAANGLMRAGAWSSAWREMEKVDVEIGVWVTDEARSKLEAWGLEHEKEEEQGEIFAMEEEAAAYSGGFQRGNPAGDTHPRAYTAASGFKDRERFNNANNGHSPASRAATSRPGSRHKVPFEPLHHTSIPSEDTTLPATDSFPSFEARGVAEDGETPLATLLRNYATRTMHRHRDILIPSLVVILGLIFAWRSMFGGTVASSLGPTVSQPASSIGSVFGSGGLSEEEIKARVSADIDAIVERVQLKACTFSPSALQSDGPQAETTALPQDDAQRALKNLVRKEAGIKEDAPAEQEKSENGDENSREELKGASSNEEQQAEERDTGFLSTINTVVAAVVDDGDLGEAVE